MPSRASVGHDIKEAKGVQERLGRDCQRLASKIFDKKNQKTMILWKDALTELSKTECMLGQRFIANIFHSCHNLVSFLLWPLLIVAMLLCQKKSVTQALLIIRSFDPIQVPRKKTCDLAKLNPVSPCICQRHTNHKKTSKKNQKTKENKHEYLWKWFEKQQL